MKNDTIYAYRKPGKWPNGEVYEDREGFIHINYRFCNGAPLEFFMCDRRTARLIAKRIDQLLRDTR
jgi:hypothetical protein